MQVYLDNAATTPIDPKVIQLIHKLLVEQYGNPSSIHSRGRTAKNTLEMSRRKIAELIGATASEIVFTSGGTEAHNTVLRKAIVDLNVEHVITSPIEHPAILKTLEATQKQDIRLSFVPTDEKGYFDLDVLDRILGSNKGKQLVSLMHANNEIGTLNDIEKIASICSSHQALFHSDTVQSVAHFPIDVSKIKIHFLGASAHKFHGPKGTGFLYINSDVKINPFMTGGGQERDLRAGTENVPLIAGMALAMEMACKEMDERRAYISGIREYMREGLMELIPGVRFNGETGDNSLYTVLSAAFPPSSANELLVQQLDINGICVSGGSACSSGAEKASHVLNEIGCPPDYKTIRFSFSHFNTRSEIDFVLSKLVECFQPFKVG
jgi:cysteine desulfurase